MLPAQSFPDADREPTETRHQPDIHPTVAILETDGHSIRSHEDLDAEPLSRPGPIDLATHPEVLRVDLRLVPSTRTLHAGAAAVQLEPRVMQVLLALADAQGQVVSRDRLLEAGWGSTVVGDDAIQRAIGGARRALRQAGVQGWAVETIARVGYRLRAMEASEASGTSETCTAPAKPGPAATVAVDATAPTPIAIPTLASPAPLSPETLALPQTQPLPQPQRRTWVVGAVAVAVMGSAAALVGWRRSGSDTGMAALESAMNQARQALRLSRPADDRRAVALLETVLAASAGHAAGWGLLAHARRAAAEAARPEDLPAALAGVEQAATRALALDPEQPDALTARATVLPAFGQWSQLDAALRAVLDRSDGNLPAMDALALSWAGTGYIAAHYPLRLRTVQDDPLHAGYNFRSIYAHWMNGQLAAADLAGERGMELWPQHHPTWAARAALLAYTGRAERALTLLDSAPTGLPPSLLAQFRLTWGALASGTAGDIARARSATLQGLERGGPLLAVSATIDLAALGEIDLALDVTESYLLERGPVRAGTRWQPGQPWHVDVRGRFTNQLFLPVTAPLRDSPRFAGLMRDIGLVDHWQRTGRAPDHLQRPGG